MSNAAVSRVVEHVAAGGGVLLTGAVPAELATTLGSVGNVVEVSSPPGGLNLSGLIAQLSGRHDFGVHDDAVLELGFRRMTTPHETGLPTVLLLQGAHGVHRSVLRYLQHLGKHANSPVMVLAGGADLVEALADPGLAELRSRLRKEAFPDPAPDSAAVETGLLSVIPVALIGEGSESAPVARLSVLSHAGKRRRPATMWAAGGAGVAAMLAIGAWVGLAELSPRQNKASGTTEAIVTPQAGAQPARLAALDLPIERAQVSPPPTALAASPERASVPHPPALSQVPAALARPSPTPPPVKFAQRDELPLASADDIKPDAVKPDDAKLGEAKLDGGKPDEAKLDEAKPDEAKPGGQAPATAGITRPVLARPRYVRRADPHPRQYSSDRRTYWPPNNLPNNPREPEGARYDWREQEPPHDYNSPPEWDPPPRYAPRPAQNFIGTYTAGPYGTRVFRYDP